MGVDTVDAESAARMARWWAEVIGGEVVDDERGFSWIEDVPGLPFDSIDFGPVPEPKTVKNRIHWDITSDDLDGILAQGATVLAERPRLDGPRRPRGQRVLRLPTLT